FPAIVCDDPVSNHFPAFRWFYSSIQPRHQAAAIAWDPENEAAAANHTAPRAQAQAQAFLFPLWSAPPCSSAPSEVLAVRYLVFFRMAYVHSLECRLFISLPHAVS